MRSVSSLSFTRMSFALAERRNKDGCKADTVKYELNMIEEIYTHVYLTIQMFNLSAGSKYGLYLYIYTFVYTSQQGSAMLLAYVCWNNVASNLLSGIFQIRKRSAVQLTWMMVHKPFLKQKNRARCLKPGGSVIWLPSTAMADNADVNHWVRCWVSYNMSKPKIEVWI